MECFVLFPGPPQHSIMVSLRQGLFSVHCDCCLLFLYLDFQRCKVENVSVRWSLINVQKHWSYLPERDEEVEIFPFPNLTQNSPMVTWSGESGSQNEVYYVKGQFIYDSAKFML